MRAKCVNERPLIRVLEGLELRRASCNTRMANYKNATLKEEARVPYMSNLLHQWFLHGYTFQKTKCSIGGGGHGGLGISSISSNAKLAFFLKKIFF